MSSVVNTNESALTQAGKAPSEKRSAGDPPAPRRHGGGLFRRFMHGLEERLGAAGAEDPHPVGRRLAGAWLSRHPRLCAWIVLALFLVELCAFASWGAQLLPFLLVAAAVWWVAVWKRGVLAATARHLSVLLLTGLTILCLALCGLNQWFTSVKPATVQRAEETLARFRLEFTDLTSLSMVQVLIVGTVLLALAVIYTNLDAAKRYDRVQSSLGSFQTLLLVLCSFVIYAQSPLQQEVHVTHDHLTDAYRAALERQWKADAQIAEAAPTRRSLQATKPSQQQQLGVVLRRIYSAGHERPHAVSVIESKVFETSAQQTAASRSAAQLDAIASTEANIHIGQVPVTPRELDDQIEVTAAAEDSASQAARAAHQSAAVVISTIVRIIELATPHFPSEAAQTIAENLFENWAGLAEPKVAEAFATLHDASAHDSKGPALTLDRADISGSDPTTFFHRGTLASPETIARAAPSAQVHVAVHPPADPSSDLSDLDHLLEDFH
jgi:hypothetical protein